MRRQTFPSYHGNHFVRVTFAKKLHQSIRKGRSHKIVAMVNRKRLSSLFFFQSVDYRLIGKVTKGQEKKFFCSSIILEKPRGGWRIPPLLRFFQDNSGTKDFFFLKLGDLSYRHILDTFEEKHLKIDVSQLPQKPLYESDLFQKHKKRLILVSSCA